MITTKSQTKLHCRWCGSAKLIKNGMGVAARRRVQRFRCNSCLRNTIKPTLKSMRRK